MPASCNQPEAPWLVCGKDHPPVFHGGRRKVRVPSLQETQKRDYGFYGRGFYVTTSASYASWYGRVVTQYAFRPDAVILEAPMSPEEAPAVLVDQVVQAMRDRWEDAARGRGKHADFMEELARVRDHPLDWRDALLDYAAVGGVSAVSFGPGGEIVVLNPDALVFVR